MIIVTGATGKLGRHVVAQLLEKVPASQLAVAVRSPEKAADIAALGVAVRHADYTDPATLFRAFAGADKLLLISGNEPGQRLPQHTAVVRAAQQTGVRQLAYTSILRADSSPLALAAEHKATEEIIRASGIPYTFLRNGWYLENYTEHFAPALQNGALIGSAGEGRIAAAARADYAAAAVRVLTTDGHLNKAYELAGDRGFTMGQLAVELASQSGKAIAYNDMPRAQYEGILNSVGVPSGMASMLADADQGIAHGALDDESGTLHALIGRSTTTLHDAVAAGLRT